MTDDSKPIVDIRAVNFRWTDENGEKHVDHRIEFRRQDETGWTALSIVEEELK